jgi:RNA polymerase sigma-70 factor, ECF subfamily
VPNRISIERVEPVEMTTAPNSARVLDDELVRLAAGGDAEAFTSLFRRRQADVFRFALHMTASVSSAEDVVQDVFLAVMRDAGRYEPGRATVVAWLFGIARNFVRRRLDSERRLEPFPVDEETFTGSGTAAVEVDPMDEMIRAEQVEALRRAVGTLPVAYREAVVLCDLQELSYNDAAAALECAVGTVRSRLHRGRALLAAKMTAAVGARVAGSGNERGRGPALKPGGCLA